VGLSDVSQIEDEAALRHYAELEARAIPIDLNWWRNELAQAGRNKARRAGVIVAAEEWGVDLGEMSRPERNPT